MRVLLDTNVLLDSILQRPPGIRTQTPFCKPTGGDK